MFKYWIRGPNKFEAYLFLISLIGLFAFIMLCCIVEFGAVSGTLIGITIIILMILFMAGLAAAYR